MDMMRMVADAIGDAIVATDRDGIIQVWNPGAERIFGHPADAALGQSLDLIIPARLRARHWEGFRQVMGTGKATTARATSSRCRACARTDSGSPWSSRSSP
jgi:PAS domain S-box-containing protein